MQNSTIDRSIDYEADEFVKANIASLFKKSEDGMVQLFQGTRRAMVFAAHPDDELIGAGGTISRLKLGGKNVRVIVFSYGGGGAPAEEARLLRENRIEAIRERETNMVAKSLGIEHRMLGLAEIEDWREVTKMLVRELRLFKPNLVFTHSPLDKHHLHRSVSQISTEASWHAGAKVYGELGKPWKISAIYYYEVFDLFTEPSMIVDVTETFNLKLKALRLYDSQLKVLPGLDDYLEALARVRGYQAGVKFGEAFMQASSIPITV